MECYRWKFIRKYSVGSKCASSDAVFVNSTTHHVTIPECRKFTSQRLRRHAVENLAELVTLKVKVPVCRQKSLQLEILNAGRVLSPVCRRLGAASAIRELGKTVRLAARVVRLRHQQNWVEVQRLPGPGYRLRIADETAIHFTCNHTHQRSAVSG
jgi:hypothetical protein